MEPYPYRYPLKDLSAAADQLVIENESNVLVSLDHDFFYPASELNLPVDNIANEHFMSTLTDWSLEEWFSIKRQMAIWTDYKERLTLAGFDPDALAKPQEIRKMANYLLNHFPAKDLFLGDSHLWGLVVSQAMVKKTESPIELIHFDTHHDAGYLNYRFDSEEKSLARAQTKPGADDWILAGLIQGLFSKVTIVYPNWRDTDEWDEINPPTVPYEYWHKINVTTFSQFIKANTLADDATYYYSRSSAFVPPWGKTDKEFLQMSNKIMPNHQCLDCMNLLTIGANNACRIRE